MSSSWHATRREEWNDLYRAVPVLWPIDPGPFLGTEVGDSWPGRALDLGAGEGRNSIWLAQRGWQVTAVDFQTSPWRAVRPGQRRRGSPSSSPG